MIIDGTIVNISMSIVVTSFQTDFALVQWVVLSSLLSFTRTLGQTIEVVHRTI